MPGEIRCSRNDRDTWLQIYRASDSPVNLSGQPWWDRLPHDIAYLPKWWARFDPHSHHAWDIMQACHCLGVNRDGINWRSETIFYPDQPSQFEWHSRAIVPGGPQPIEDAPSAQGKMKTLMPAPYGWIDALGGEHMKWDRWGYNLSRSISMMMDIGLSLWTKGKRRELTYWVVCGCGWGSFSGIGRGWKR